MKFLTLAIFMAFFFNNYLFAQDDNAPVVLGSITVSPNTMNSECTNTDSDQEYVTKLDTFISNSDPNYYHWVLARRLARNAKKAAQPLSHQTEKKFKNFYKKALEHQLVSLKRFELTCDTFSWGYVTLQKNLGKMVDHRFLKTLSKKDLSKICKACIKQQKKLNTLSIPEKKVQRDNCFCGIPCSYSVLNPDFAMRATALENIHSIIRLVDSAKKPASSSESTYSGTSSGNHCTLQSA